MLTLGAVAWALGVNEKTADNAIRTLGIPRPLDEATACALGLALGAKHRYGIPLKRGFPVARDAMIRPTARRNDVLVQAMRSQIDAVRARVRVAARDYRPLPRGPRRRDRSNPGLPPNLRRRPAVRRAEQWGLDLTLNRACLRRSVGWRLTTASANARATAMLRGGKASVSLESIWEELVAAGVRFVVIGGVAGIAHGSARVTRDLDICYDAARDSTDRLVRVLGRWHARLRVARAPNARLPFVIDRRTFRDAPALTLDTDHGPLDLLPVVAGVGDYAACVAESEVKRVGKVRLRVLSLDALIKAKRAAGRARDIEHLVELEALRTLRR